MKKIFHINKIIFTALIVILITGNCEKYLDKAPSAELPEDSVFGSPRLFKKYVDGLYPYLWYSRNWGDWATYAFGGFCRIGMSCLEDATDLSDGARESGPRVSFNRGSWLGGVPEAEVVWPWEGAYKAIRICNRILDNVNNVDGLTPNERKEIKGQAYFFRGFFHFEIVKRYGGVPYIKRVLTANEDMDLPRDTYDDCIQWLCDDLDSAAFNLPVQFPASEFGRPEKGAAMAIKARALLYAASPLNNPANSADKWIKAAEASYAVMVLVDSTGGKRYGLESKANYPNIFYGKPFTKETIFSRNAGPGGFENSQLSFPGWGSFLLGVGARPWSNEWGATPCPTQNLMDMYEMADGQKLINNYSNYSGLTPDINPAAISQGYNDTTPAMYENRDPRLKLTFLLNGTPWLDATAGIELFFSETSDPTKFTPGKHIDEGVNWTRTGYLEKKFWDPQLSPTSGTTYLNYSFIRYTDIVLMYAEAMNEAYGPDADGLGNGRTARMMVDSVRLRVGHVKVIASNQAELRERIENERAIELVYEDLRWFDVLRWKKGVEIFNKPVYGIRTIKKLDGTFRLKRTKVMDRVFKDYMHRYPIPQSEIDKSFNLKQNPGWVAE